MNTINKFAAFVLLLFGLVVPHLNATPVTYVGTQGGLKAQVDFAISGGNLVVTLSNTSANDVMVPTNVLTGVFFDLLGDPVLTRVSAVLAPGSSVVHASQPAGGVVGGEWAYKRGLNVDGAFYGLSSVGLGLFGSGDRFSGPNLAGPNSPDGLQYGLVSAGDNPATGNTPVITEPLIKNAVVMSLSGLPAGFDPFSAVSNVYFQYGTGLCEPRFPGDIVPNGEIPEPGTFALVGAGLIAVAFIRRRHKAGRKPA